MIDLAGAFLFRRRAAAAAPSNRRGAHSMDPLKTDNRTESAFTKQNALTIPASRSLNGSIK
ncbi:hypothetical protein YSA_09411 [Pseudomonas putida ND6]|uniref:Uncharacterized protein n=1 Tax=Pseudomonas putida ND6 TaxID=231023 RepID=I3V292_PSEPU|nr:hypothetical protein YSA_09411 [Pseudomonas putida ND6]